MENKILFFEKQKFTQWWLWLILIVVNGGLVVAIITQYLKKNYDVENPITLSGFIIVLSVVLLLTLLFCLFKLETKIQEDGIAVRFFPFHLKFKHFPWDDLSKCYVRKYAPLMEYGGWGLRYGLSNSGVAYNVKGNKGLQLLLTSKNKKILIGTQNPEKIAQVLRDLKQEKR